MIDNDGGGGGGVVPMFMMFVNMYEVQYSSKKRGKN